MNRTLWCGLALVALMTGLAVRARAAEQPELAGVYICQGVKADGGEYRGFVQIAKHHDTLILTWRFPHGPGGTVPPQPEAVGVGIVSGNTFAVSYYSKTIAAVVVYAIEQDGQRLVGRWTAAGGDGSVHSETLTRLPGHVPPSAEGEQDDRPREKHDRPRRQKNAPTATEAVKRDIYEQHQVPLHKMNVVSYGEEKPVSSNRTRDGLAQNPRIVIRVLS